MSSPSRDNASDRPSPPRHGDSANDNPPPPALHHPSPSPAMSFFFPITISPASPLDGSRSTDDRPGHGNDNDNDDAGPSDGAGRPTNGLMTFHIDATGSTDHASSPQVAPPTTIPPATTTTTASPSAPPPEDGTQPSPSPQEPRRPPPTVFILTPDGRLVPHPAPSLPSAHPHAHHPHPPSPSTTTSATPAPAPAPLASPLPPMLNFGIFPFPFAMPFGPTEPQPDPAKAAELLRSLPGVSKGLFERVNRVYKAEDADEGEEGGWKCSVCLEGVDLDQASARSGEGNDVKMGGGGVEEGTQAMGVKVLPCNHIFHESCLEPWFQTKHTCPTCRLDLDPLQTLKSPRQGQQSVRPGATGSGRTGPATPYAREGAGELAPAEAPTTQAASDIPPLGAPIRFPPFTFIWPAPAPPRRIPTPAASDTSRLFTPILPVPQIPAQPASAPSRTEATTSAEAAAATTPSTAPERPSTPSRTIIINFDLPLRASPLPMERSASAPSPSLTNANLPNPNPAAVDGRPHPERRPHITVVHRSPAPHGGVDQPQHQPASTVPPPVGAPPLFHFFPQPIVPPPRPEPEVKKSPFVAQSLESWTTTRERALGWRCDAPECLIAPPTDNDEAASLEDPDDWSEDAKELLSIYDPVQPEHHRHQQSSSKDYTRLACAHRWHRGCLEVSERASGRGMSPGEVEEEVDEDGVPFKRIWVRCGACRKDGWVRGRRTRSEGGEEEEKTPSEIEVEQSVVA